MYLIQAPQTLQVVWGKGEIILDSVQLASDSRVVWPLGCKSNKGPPKGSNELRSRSLT